MLTGNLPSPGSSDLLVVCMEAIWRDTGPSSSYLQYPLGRCRVGAVQRHPIVALPLAAVDTGLVLGHRHGTETQEGTKFKLCSVKITVLRSCLRWWNTSAEVFQARSAEQAVINMVEDLS